MGAVSLLSWLRKLKPDFARGRPGVEGGGMAWLPGWPGCCEASIASSQFSSARVRRDEQQSTSGSDRAERLRAGGAWTSCDVVRERNHDQRRDV